MNPGRTADWRGSGSPCPRPGSDLTNTIRARGQKPAPHRVAAHAASPIRVPPNPVACRACYRSGRPHTIALKSAVDFSHRRRQHWISPISPSRNTGSGRTPRPPAAYAGGHPAIRGTLRARIGELKIEPGEMVAGFFEFAGEKMRPVADDRERDAERFNGSTTKREAGAKPARDRRRRDFSTDGPDRLWVADISHLSTPRCGQAACSEPTDNARATLRALDIANCIKEVCPWSRRPAQADSLTLYGGDVVGFRYPRLPRQARGRPPPVRGSEGVVSRPSAGVSAPKKAGPQSRGLAATRVHGGVVGSATSARVRRSPRPKACPGVVSLPHRRLGAESALSRGLSQLIATGPGVTLRQRRRSGSQRRDSMSANRR